MWVFLSVGGKVKEAIDWNVCWNDPFKIRDRNLDYTVDLYKCTCLSHFVEHDGGLSTMDGSVDGNYPYMDHFVVDMLMISVSSAALTIFDHNNNRHLLGTFAVFANCQIVRLDHCLSWQNAEKFQQFIFFFY